ncbi:MAG: GxxExxY protein [Phycisphaerales bacterium]|nr:GxxExxY protein [Phycisphaerales bacterium]
MNAERGYGGGQYGDSRGGYRHGGPGGQGGGGQGGYGGQGGNYGNRGEGERRRGTPLSELDPALTEVSRKTIGCAIETHMELGPGYDESVYLKALMIELAAEGVPHKAGHPFQVMFDEQVVGQVVADLWVADRFIVEVMARPGEVTSYERALLRAQLRAADVELGLIINFGERRLKDGLVRVLNPDKLNAMKDGDEHDDGGHDEEQSRPGEPAA